MRPEGGEPVQVTRNGGRYAVETPDGQWLIVSDSPRLLRTRLDGSGETLLRDGVRTNYWSVGGSNLYVIDEGGSDLFRAPFSGTVFEKVAHFDKAHEAAGAGNCLAVPRDESFLIYRGVVRTVNTLMLMEGWR
jgi:hypothetical protein